MFEYEFMQRAFWAGGLIGVIAPILGVYLMLRRQVLMADTLSHVSLAGVDLGSVMNLNPVICGFTIAIIGALLVEQLRRSYRTYSEVPVAIIMTSGLALAVVLMSLKTNLSKTFSSYLFGSIVAVSDMQLWMMAGVCVIDFAKEHQVKIIFFETLVSSKVSETIASEVGAKTAVLNPIEGLTEEEIAAGMDYISVMRQNLEALKLALNE